MVLENTKMENKIIGKKQFTLKNKSVFKAVVQIKKLYLTNYIKVMNIYSGIPITYEVLTLRAVTALLNFTQPNPSKNNQKKYSYQKKIIIFSFQYEVHN